jgi:hypothetical protein
MFEMLEHRGNKDAMANIDDKASVSGMLEMFLPAACLEYHTARRHSPFRTVELATLFDSSEQAYTDADVRSYTHVIGRSKSKLTFARKLASRVQAHYPRHYDRCVEYSRSYGVSRPSS